METLSVLLLAALVSLSTIDVGAQPAGDIEKLKNHRIWPGPEADPPRCLVLCNRKDVRDALGDDLKPGVTFSDVFAKLLTEAQEKVLKSYYVAGFSEWLSYPTQETTFWPYFRVFREVLVACGRFKQSLNSEDLALTEEVVQKIINQDLNRLYLLDGEHFLSKKMAPWGTKLMENINNDDIIYDAESVAREIVKIMFEDPDVHREVSEMFKGSAPIPEHYDAFTIVDETLKRKIWSE